MAYLGERVPMESWTPQRFKDFEEFRLAVEKFDQSMGQPDCVDPLKEQLIADIKFRLQMDCLQRKLG